MHEGRMKSSRAKYRQCRTKAMGKTGVGEVNEGVR